MCERAGFDYKPLFPNRDQMTNDVGITMVTKDGIEVYLTGMDEEVDEVEKDE